MPQGAKAMKMPAGQTDSLASKALPEEPFKLFRSIVLGHRVKM